MFMEEGLNQRRRWGEGYAGKGQGDPGGITATGSIQGKDSTQGAAAARPCSVLTDSNRFLLSGGLPFAAALMVQREKRSGPKRMNGGKERLHQSRNVRLFRARTRILDDAAVARRNRRAGVN
ncbi:hypothetical protein [Novosphingobium panipatense]|uniref:hypothetical protein n=1 Tax=Novosphingobium panipatense TaxID=428991 RepID=UPI0024B6A8A7|nr:hypothetical protein [Novosphingobium panipatense]